MSSLANLFDWAGDLHLRASRTELTCFMCREVDWSWLGGACWLGVLMGAIKTRQRDSSE
jgi:hypothetical protein